MQLAYAARQLRYGRLTTVNVSESLWLALK